MQHIRNTEIIFPAINQVTQSPGCFKYIQSHGPKKKKEEEAKNK